MFFLKVVSYILVLGFCVFTRTLVGANGGLCDGGECVVSPVPDCPENGVFSEQENGCIVTEPMIQSCPEGFKLSRGGTQCSKNVHTGKILTCPENTRYDKHTQACYVESRETPECEAGYIEDGNGDCYRLKEAEMSCGEREEEREDGCYTKRLVRKEYGCREIPQSIRAIHELDNSSYTSSTAFLDGEREYSDDGSRPPVCKVKVFHKPVCPENSTEDAKGSCILRSRPEIFCPEGYLLRDVEQQAGEPSTTLESRHYCQKEEFVEPVSECPGGMVKENDHSGLDVCYLVKQEVPRQCPIGFVYIEGHGKCVRREPATPRCNPGYVHRGGFCYLQERQVLEISPISYCMDPEAVVVGQYCVRNQSMAPSVDCPMGYIFDQAESQCKKNIEIDPITTCPPRFVLNPQAQVCERRVEKDCSTTQHKKKCTSYDSETGVGIDREVIVQARSLNAASGHGGHHHHHKHIVPIGSTKVVHQCVEIPEYIPKMCVNVETAPVVYVCHDGIQSTEKRKCIKVSMVMASFSCPREFKLRNGQCEQQSIDSILYKCSEGYFLSESPTSKLPKCIPNEEMNKEKKMSALFECPENSELIRNEFNQFECVETKSPICMSENCRSIAKISGPEWRCPAGTEILPHRDVVTARIQSGRVLVSSHHPHNSSHSTNKIVSNIREAPRCVAVVTQPIEKKCSRDRSVLMGDYCLETLEKSCPTGGCESYLEFKPSVECPESTEPLGLHNADMCVENTKKPFRYHCLTGGKITQHNKCRYIVKKSCKHPNCIQLTPAEGRMQCPPGYSEVKIVSSHSIAGSTQENSGHSFQMTSFPIPSAMGQRRKLFGSVRPLSNVGQCAALEFAPFILSCPNGFTQSEGKCIGVMDPSYQCPNGTYMRQDGLCGKPTPIENNSSRRIHSGGGNQSGLLYQHQMQYTRKNKL